MPPLKGVKIMEDAELYLNVKEIEEMGAKMGYSKIMIAREKDGTPVYAVMRTNPKVPPMSKGGVIDPNPTTPEVSPISKKGVILKLIKLILFSIISSLIYAFIASEIMQLNEWWQIAITIFPLVLATNEIYLTINKKQ